MVACQLPKLNARVRFPLPAPVGSAHPVPAERASHFDRSVLYDFEARPRLARSLRKDDKGMIPTHVSAQPDLITRSKRTGKTASRDSCTATAHGSPGRAQD